MESKLFKLKYSKVQRRFVKEVSGMPDAFANIIKYYYQASLRGIPLSIILEVCEYKVVD